MGFQCFQFSIHRQPGSQFRKGKNNSLTPAAEDPGSPWAIGNAAGGHDAFHPDLGDFAAFDRFVTKARSLGHSVAVDRRF